jgi:hypothetical protein
MTVISSEKTADRLKRELILSAEEDYVDLSTYARIVEEVLGFRAPEDIYRTTMGTVYELLSDRFVTAGVPTPDGGFEPWTGGIVNSMSRMQSGWQALGRIPELGELVWFDATERGISYAEGTLED